MRDPEIEAMSAVSQALSTLDDETRVRVIRWAADKYGVTSRGSLSDSPRDQGRGSSADTADFEHFGELFAAADPTTNEDRALVAAFWVQVVQNNDQWASRLLNNELKHLGHSIPNVTDALSTAIKRKPQRVIQLKKSGKSQQSVKTYKLTEAGVTHVRSLIAGADE